MTFPASNGPDRSLLIAATVLVGGCLLGAGTLYLATTLAEELAPLRPTHTTAWGEQQRDTAPHYSAVARPTAPTPPRMGGLRAQSRSQPLAGGRLPAWAESGPTAPPARRPSPPPKTYELRADLSHARVEALPSPGETQASAPEAPSNALAASRPSAAPNRSPSPDLTPESAASGAETEWTSELSRLNGRLRALDGALAQLNRNDGSAARGQTKHSQRTEALRGESGAERTASAPSPPNEPPQVPVDGGLGWLAAAGAAYATQRLWAQSGAGTETT